MQDWSDASTRGCWHARMSLALLLRVVLHMMTPAFGCTVRLSMVTEAVGEGCATAASALVWRALSDRARDREQQRAWTFWAEPAARAIARAQFQWEYDG